MFEALRSRPNPWLILTVVFAFSAIVAAALSRDKTPAHPLVIDPPVLDLGQPAANASVEAVFQVSNNSATELELLGVQTFCGCTGAKLSTEVVPPGGSAQVLVTVKTGLTPRAAEWGVVLYWRFAGERRMREAPLRMTATVL